MNNLCLFCCLFAMSFAASAEVLVVNKGVGGATSAHGLGRFERDVIDQKPRYVVLYFGMNDAHKKVSIDAFKSNLNKMIEQARKHNIKPMLITLNPINAELVAKRCNEDAEYLAARNVAFDKAIREVAEETKTPMVDLRKTIEENGGISLDKTCLVGNPANGRGNDGVHLIAKGYEKMAETVADVLKNDVRDGDIVVCLGDSITWGAGMKGAGTAYGETYPAWLYMFLNNAVCKEKLSAPRPMPEGCVGNLISNASFELADPAGMPDLYRQIFRKSQSQIWMKSVTGTDVPDGKRYLQINTENNKVAEIWPQVTWVKQGENYRLKFTARGHGQVLVQLKLRLPTEKSWSVPVNLTNDWVSLTKEWKQYDFTFTPQARAYISMQILVKGKIDLDNLYFGIGKNL